VDHDRADRLPPARGLPSVPEILRRMAWWGLALYLFQLGSRRHLDYHLDERGTQILANLNRLGGTAHTSRPVDDTLDHFLVVLD
jgi:hypothetical protein